MRPIRNRYKEERAIIYRGALEGLSLDEVNVQLPPEVACPKSSYDQVKRLEARAIREGKVTLEALIEHPLSRTELSDLLR